jgi:hypothetical protein
MMAELTQAQIDRVSADLHYCKPPKSKQGWEIIVRTIAPELQLPWDGPTDSEIKELLDDIDHSSAVMHPILERARFALKEFIGARNRALLPKPVDPVAVHLCLPSQGWAVTVNGVYAFGGDGISRCDAEIYADGLRYRRSKEISSN